jgi:archaellum biogenesis ATPase FlaH
LPTWKKITSLPERLAILVAERMAEPQVAPDDDEAISQGERHEALYKWALSALTSQGLTGKPMLDGMLGHNARCLDPPLPDSEVERLWKWVDKSRIAQSERELAAVQAVTATVDAPAPAAEANLFQSPNGSGPDGEESASRPRLRLLDTYTFTDSDPEPIDWIAPGVAARGKAAMVAGREKRGKSYLCAGLAVAAASGGGDVADIKVRAARVLYVDAENGQREIHRRVRQLGLEREHAGNITFAEALGFDLRRHLDELERAIADTTAELVVIDSFRPAWTGDERDEARIAETLDPLRQLAHFLDVAIVLIHHAQKKHDAEYRGSSAIGAAIEWCVMLERIPGDEDRARRKLSNPLARFAPEREDRWLRIVSDGDEEPVTFEQCDAYGRRGRGTSTPTRCSTRSRTPRVPSARWPPRWGSRVPPPGGFCRTWRRPARPNRQPQAGWSTVRPIVGWTSWTTLQRVQVLMVQPTETGARRCRRCRSWLTISANGVLACWRPGYRLYGRPQ